jgi:hypothetical protein
MSKWTARGGSLAAVGAHFRRVAYCTYGINVREAEVIEVVNPVRRDEESEFTFPLRECQTYDRILRAKVSGPPGLLQQVRWTLQDPEQVPHVRVVYYVTSSYLRSITYDDPDMMDDEYFLRVNSFMVLEP